MLIENILDKSDIVMKIYLLGNIADVQTGPFGSQLHQEDYVEFGTPMVTVEHLGNRVFTKQNLPMISDSDKKRLNKYVLNEGDIVFSRVGSVDRCSYVDNKHSGWMFSGRCLRIRPCNVVYPLYLYYYFCMENTKQLIRNIAVGATMPSINTKLMKNLEVPLPTMEIQQKIASILSALDDKIELNNKINENLESQAQAIFKSWFVDFEPFGGVKPEEWTEKSVYDLAEYINGAAFKKNEYSTEGIPIIKIAELKNGITDSTQYCCIEKDEKYYFDNKAILFSWSGNPETSIDTFLWYRGKAILNQHTFRVVSKYNAPAFTYFLLKYLKPKFTYIASNKQTTGLGHVTVSDLKRLQFSCSTDDIEEFEKMSKPLFDMIYNTYVESNRLSKLRDVLLPKLMNGEIDVSEVKI